MPQTTLQPELMKQLEQIAVERETGPEELVEAAVCAYLRQIERETIKAEAKAFRSMHAELVKEYRGQYVAIHNGQVVDHGQDFQSLHNRVRHRFGHRPVLLRRVEAEPERVLAFRSPLLERGQP